MQQEKSIESPFLSIKRAGLIFIQLICLIVSLYVLQGVIAYGTLIYAGLNPDSGFDYVQSVAFSPDGRILASGSSLVKLWDTSSGHLIRKFSSPDGRPTYLTFSPDGRTLAGCGDQNNVILWEIASGHKLTLRTSKNQISDIRVAFSPDGRILATGNDDGTIQLWDPASGRQIRTIKATDGTGYRGVTSLAFSPAGQIVASAGTDNTTKFWDPVSGSEIRRLPERSDALAFSRDGHMVAGELADGIISLWDPVAEKQIGCIHQGKRLRSVAINPDGQILASGGTDGTVGLWNPISGRQIRTLFQHADSIGSVAFSPDGHTLASAGDDNTIKLWDAVSGREIRTVSQISPIEKVFKWIEWSVFRNFSPD